MFKLKNLLLLTLLFAAASFLVIGAVQRTQSKSVLTNNTDEPYARAAQVGSHTGYSSRQNTTTGVPLNLASAYASEMQTLEGTVTAMDPFSLTVQSGSEEILLDGRAFSFALEQGLTAQVEDPVSLTGFYEDGLFEITQWENLRTQQIILIRDPSGRPLWAGGGRRSS